MIESEYYNDTTSYDEILDFESDSTIKSVSKRTHDFEEEPYYRSLDEY